MLDLEPIKARLAAATPGPWEMQDEYIACPDGDFVCTIVDGGTERDAMLIANAPTDLAALVAEVEALRNPATRTQTGGCTCESLMAADTLASEWQARAEKAEAEVERLRAEMDRAQREGDWG